MGDNTWSFKDILGQFVTQGDPGVLGRKKGEVDEDIRTMAVFADAAYKRTTRDRESMIQKHIDTDWIVDRDLSNHETAVFVNKEKNQVVTAFRGTKDVVDLHTDLAIVVGHEKMTKRFRKADKEYGQILNKYQGFNHSLSGHSMGGSINMYLAERYDGFIDEVHNFNPGSSVSSVRGKLKGVFDKRDRSHINDYFIHGDALSTMGRGDPGHTQHVLAPLKGSTNFHSIDQFLK
jgi:hypothetical protein